MMVVARACQLLGRRDRERENGWKMDRVVVIWVWMDSGEDLTVSDEWVMTCKVLICPMAIRSGRRDAIVLSGGRIKKSSEVL